jgi:hypothetical protein
MHAARSTVRVERMSNRTALLSFPLLALTVAALPACAAPSADDDTTVPAPETELEPSGFGPPQPAWWTNLRVYPQVNVQVLGLGPGPSPIYLVALGTNINLPCAATNVSFTVIYQNEGTLAAGTHHNKGYFSPALLPFQNNTHPGLAAGATTTSTFTKNISGTVPNTLYTASFQVDWPDGVSETVSTDNSAWIRVTRVCP